MSPQDFFSPFNAETVALLEQAYDTTWVTLMAHGPFDKEQTFEMSVSLSRKLVTLVADGVSDPAQLRTMALESLTLPSTHS
jgi:hypothetical protein